MKDIKNINQNVYSSENGTDNGGRKKPQIITVGGIIALGLAALSVISEVVTGTSANRVGKHVSGVSKGGLDTEKK
ncbi:MAG: hypothetical protein OSJ61_08825 [Lachnospiraceae bacterium]|nr:hypothetical protein [Lachnospiraceae bacterium]